MIAAANERLGDEPNVELTEGDARDLSPLEGQFDFILFSFNGIDAVSPEDRLRVLDQVRAKLKPGGLFQFSAHSLGALPFDEKRALSPRFAGSRAYRLSPGERLSLCPQHPPRQRRTRPRRGARPRLGPGHLDRPQLPDPRLLRRPRVQVAQLREHGLEVVAVFDTAGVAVTLPHHSRDPWFDYLCAPIAT